MAKSKRGRALAPRQTPTGFGLLQQAIEQLEQGDLVRAQSLAREALEELPGDARPYHVLGRILFQMEKPEAAINYLRQARVIEPGYFAAANDLGNVYQELDRADEAIRVFEDLVVRQPGCATTTNNLGIAYKTARRLDEAEKKFEEALTHDPDHAKARLNLGYTRLLKNDIPGATSDFEQAVARLADDIEPLMVLGHLYRMQSQQDKARAVYARIVELEPEHAIANHMLQAIDGNQTLTKASTGFVRSEFDQFADSFNEKLAALDYRGPQVVVDLLARHLDANSQLDVLDAGCGTGLAGTLLKPFARRLVGVDLSPKMLEQARATGLYDELQVADLGAFLEANPAKFDAIVVVDTLIYFGDLELIIRQLAGSLKPGGVLVVTVEEQHDSGQAAGYELAATGRFRHLEEYLNRCLELAGMGERVAERLPLRQENDVPVDGLLVLSVLQ